jgi:hypothetical protein
MVVLVHKNTNVSLLLIVCDASFCTLAKHINLEVFLEVFNFLTPKLPFDALKTIWRSKKSWSPRETLKIAD